VTLGRSFVCAAVLATTAPALAMEPPSFRFERVVTTERPGPQRLPVDVALLTNAEPGHKLADLRLFDGRDRELGYLLVDSSPPPPSWREGSISPVRQTRDESGFEADLGAPLSVARLRIGGIPAPFAKRVRVEASADRVHWVTLANDATLFDLPDDGLRRLEMGFAPGVFRYVHLTWDDHSSARVPLPASVALEQEPESTVDEPLVATLPFVRRASEPRTSRFRVRLPAVRLPIVALELECGGNALLRPVRVLEPRLEGREVTPRTLGNGTLRRAVRNALVAADLRVPIEPPSGADLDVVVDDGDNAPLDLTVVHAVFAPQPFIYFEADAGGPIVARFGNAKLSAPRYDLEAMRDHVAARNPAPARWGELRPVTDAAGVPPEPGDAYPLEGAALDRHGFAFTRRITSGRQGLTAVLLDAAVLAHAHGFDDLRVIDGAQRQVPYLVEKRDEPLSIDLTISPEPTRAAGHSRYRILLPYATLPSARLVIATSSHVFERQLTVEADVPEPRSPRDPATRVVQASHWSHRDPETGATPLVLDLPPLGVDYLFLDVEEGDNRALPISHASLLLPSSRLRFFRAGDGELALLYGRGDLGAPRYDLELLAPRLVGVAAEEVALEAEATGDAPPPPSPAPRRVFWGALVGAVIALVLLIGRLVAKSEAT